MERVSSINSPKATDFVAPYFFFASGEDTRVHSASPSLKDVLGYRPENVCGMTYKSFLCEEDPLNEDVEECIRTDLSDGRTLHALRSVRDVSGQRRVLSVHTVGFSEFRGGPVVSRHSIARDITDSVTTHARLMNRLQKLDFAVQQLSRQEREVAEKIIQGKVNRDIARELEVSNRTVERRRASILKHLDAATTSEMVSKMVERDLLQSWNTAADDAQWQQARNADRAFVQIAG